MENTEKPVKIVVASDELVSTKYLHLVAPFFNEVLKLDPKTAIITDESSLIDFVGCGEYSIEGDKYADICKSWFAEVTAAIEEKYGIKVDDIEITLPELFELIENNKS